MAGWLLADFIAYVSYQTSDSCRENMARPSFIKGGGVRYTTGRHFFAESIAVFTKS